jgi:hypothetical protein
MRLDEFFAGQDQARGLFEILRAEVEAIGPAELRITKSQIAFRRRRGFAQAWMPRKYLRGDLAPLVLTVSFRRRDPSPRWKQIVEPTPGRFTHHLELRSHAEIDDEVRAWLKEAWANAA